MRKRKDINEQNMKRSGPDDIHREVREGERGCFGHAEGTARTHSALSVCESVNKVSVFAHKDSSVTADGVFRVYCPCKMMQGFLCRLCDSVALDVVSCGLWLPPYIMCCGNIISEGISPEDLGLSPVQM